MLQIYVGIIDLIRRDCDKHDSHQVTSAIFVGIIDLIIRDCDKTRGFYYG